ncbi:MAG: hypothetical protein QNJ60_02335 [Xenococcaceae cyanobacterium MO_188.B19]|nr:hypothetical protein [Xenococcaceae cyanobacterium MO_188.B19]
MNKMSYALTTLAAISMTFLPATAMEAPLNESVTSTNNSTDATYQINKATKTNYCIRVFGTWWC